MWTNFNLKFFLLSWSIVLRCDDHTGIFTSMVAPQDTYFYVKKTRSYLPLIIHSPLHPTPPPPPPDNDRICDHNAMLAFAQEKVWDVQMY